MQASRKRTFFVIVLAVVFPALLVAQGQRGKIAGTVRDGASGEPLIGANVLIKGTTLGASTDLDGNYVILNVPPGIYLVTCSMIGYGQLTQSDVSASIDRTTELNFQLEEATIEMEEVVVVAQRAKIVKDQTSTAQTIESREIRAAPTEGLRGALDMQASFQKNEKGVYSVRGSGNYEVGFQINGVTQMNSSTTAPGSFGTDKADNSWKYDVNPLGVQQVQLISGGFSAEYGNAQAGIVKVVTKEGGPRFTGEFQMEYRPPGQYHYGPYLYDQNNYEWSRWGRLDYWMSQRRNIAEQLKLNTRYPDLFGRYYGGTATGSDSAAYESLETAEITWAHGVWVKNHAPGEDNPFGVYDYREYAYTRYLVGFGGPLGRNPEVLKFFFSGEYRSKPTRLPTPERLQVYQNYILNVITQPMPSHKFKIMGMYQSYTGGIWSGSDDIRWSGIAFTPPGISTKYIIDVDPVRTELTLTQSLNWVYTITNTSFVEATLSHQTERYELPYKTLPSYNQQADRLDSLYDASGTVLKEGSWWDSQYFRGPFGFSTNYYQDSRTEHISLTADYTNQFTTAHLLKAGVRAFYWDMVNNGVNSSFQANTYVARSGFAEYYRAYPWSLSAYAQDKMEFASMVMNIGLRVEAYNFQEEVAADLFDPLYPGTSGPGIVGDPTVRNSKTHSVVLPRLGISFPIGENTAFRLQYGHFASMPVFSQGLSQRTESGWIGRANPDLGPKKTINYEFGVQQVIENDYRMDLALYYNDRIDQVGLQYYAAYTGSRNRPAGFTTDNTPLYRYTTFANNVYGSSVGLELTFENVDVSRWKYRLSYNLSQTTEGRYGESILYPEDRRAFSQQTVTSEQISPYDRTHNFRAFLAYNLEPGGGPRIFGVHPFDNMSVAITYTLQSGLPYAYITEYDVQDVVYNRRYPIENAIDLNLTKTLNIDRYRIFIGLRVMNLFDNSWLTPMDTRDDLNNWVEKGITLDNPGTDPTRLSYVVAPYRTYRNIPRQIFLTAGFGF